MLHRLDFQIVSQPDEITCGPTCLHSIYRYYDDAMPLGRVLREVPMLEEGGTLAVFLACHALARGYNAKIYTWNMEVFDPTWFHEDGTPLLLRGGLEAQMRFKRRPKLRLASKGYLDFIDLGGELRLRDLSPGLIRKYLRRNCPIITGLSSTYLYRAMREHGPNCDDDAVRGDPSGHFVVIYGYDPETKEIHVADPLVDNPPFASHSYTVPVERLITAILLGVLTYDANLLVIEPPNRRATHPTKDPVP